MLSTLSPEVYNKVLRKMNKTHNSIGSNPGSAEPLSPSQRMKRRDRRQIRLITDQPRVSVEKSSEKGDGSEEKFNSQKINHRDRRVGKSQV